MSVRPSVRGESPERSTAPRRPSTCRTPSSEPLPQHRFAAVRGHVGKLRRDRPAVLHKAEDGSNAFGPEHHRSVCRLGEFPVGYRHGSSTLGARRLPEINSSASPRAHTPIQCLRAAGFTITTSPDS